MLRHDLRRALLSPRTLFVALVYGVLLSLGATETWNDSAAYQFAFSYKTGFYILFYLCAVLPYGCGYLEDRLSGYWRFLRRAKLQQVLYEMRQSSPHWLDLQLRHGELRKVLHQMRQTQARRRPSVPLRQMRLGARGSKVSHNMQRPPCLNDYAAGMHRTMWFAISKAWKLLENWSIDPPLSQVLGAAMS